MKSLLRQSSLLSLSEPHFGVDKWRLWDCMELEDSEAQNPEYQGGEGGKLSAKMTTCLRFKD